MEEQKKECNMKIPVEIFRRFERLGGMPIDVIAELFNRMKIPEKLQGDFWDNVLQKDVHCISGKVSRVKTYRDGKTQVTIDSTATGDAPKEGEATPLENYFYAPEEITDAQLAELKRAQSAGLCVTVCFQMEKGGRPVSSVEVFECPK